MPQEQLFEMDVGQPFFDAPSRQLVTGVNTFSTDSEDGN
jgi:hypothetical protein